MADPGSRFLQRSRTSITLALLCLAAACSGGGPSAPASTNSANAPAPASEPAPEPAEDTRILVPALPGLVGYDIPEATARGALGLAGESVENPWAEETEATITDIISEVIDASMQLVAIECRSTWCGFVIDLPAGSEQRIGSELRERLQAAFSTTSLGTVTTFRLDGTSWIAMYVEIRRLA